MTTALPTNKSKHHNFNFRLKISFFKSKLLGDRNSETTQLEIGFNLIFSKYYWWVVRGNVPKKVKLSSEWNGVFWSDLKREQEIISEKLNNSMKRIIMRSMFQSRCYCIVRGCSFCVAQCWLRQGELSLKMKAKVSLPALPTRTSRTWWIVLPFVGFACAELFYNQTYRTKEFLRLQMKYYFSACTGNVHRNVETFLSFLLESRMECQRYCFDKNKRREEKVPVIVHEGHLCLVFAEFS